MPQSVGFLVNPNLRVIIITITYALWDWGMSMTINLTTPDGIHLKQLTEEDRTYRYDADWFDPIGRLVSPETNYLTIWGEIKVPASVRR